MKRLALFNAELKYCRMVLEKQFGLDTELGGEWRLLQMVVAGRMNGVKNPEDMLAYLADYCGSEPDKLRRELNTALDDLCGAIKWEDIYRWLVSGGESCGEGGELED